MHTKMYELKKELKELAVDIRNTKTDLKEHQRAHNGWQGPFLSACYSKSRNYRHKHIAYSMLRGRAYEEIERTCREEPDWDLIERIKNEYAAEDVRACTTGS